ncbi:hypothetical protein Pcinc_016635 [Petrolisthes cinctipes]|uniref:Reverse transcriptase domain-containing protein n=1 Tax=Petrolisthes cinctipes TaxID=88211 RepID=A0AAE1FSK5_PETCI|nr:hypothetical protein Pcinc_016635 [Petrolisthes cinctipes]
MPKSVDAQHDTILSQLLEACITHVTQRSSSSNTTTIPRDRHPQAIINIIKDQYETVFSTLLPSKVIHDKTSFFNSPIEREEQLLDVNITSHDITNAIKTLKTNSAAGPDLLPAILLKQCALEVSLPLLTFYRESLAFGVVPRLLRSARITPIYKGGSKESSNQLNKGQHGFRWGQSCLSQLLVHHGKIVSALDSNTMLDVIYLDFAKVFDDVDHEVLLHKLRYLGISGRLGFWISEFLTNRTQFVAVGGACSDVSSVVSDIPQGSVLGPLLFLIHIHDIDHEITHSTGTSFADDARISRTINNQDDAVLLQKDLDTIYKWAATNNMAFNHTKLENLTYNTNPSAQPTTSNTALDGSPITNPSKVQDLGVCFSSDAIFSAHIATTAKKVHSQLETFKATLDRFLRTLPDEPPMPHNHFLSSTNSIVDWLAIQCADGRFTYHEAATHRDLEAEQHCC